MSLIHLIYTSAAKFGLDERTLAEILGRSRVNNSTLGVTGMLLHAEGSILQAIEGEASVVDALYTKIARDPRHCKVVQLIREPIARRVFADWTMGFASHTRQELEAMDGVNDFFGAGVCFDGLCAGRIKKLLAAFASGRWRTRSVALAS